MTTLPHVTLAYAQSLDGCIAAQPGRRSTLSGPQSLVFTHQLRAAHDAILVGVGTVLVDNPRLTVRLAPGAHPQPVVLDSLLRIPDDCALLTAPARQLWLICDEDAPEGRQRALEARGAQVLRLALRGPYPARWPALLTALAARGVGTLMVEGGAWVITSLLQSGLACKLALTVAPIYLAGLPGVQPAAAPLPVLSQVRHRQFGDDMLIEADLNHD